MQLVHAFRLREPWQRVLAADAAVWSRGFHRPTGLTASDALWLVVAGLPPEAQLALNGRRLQPACPERPGEFEVTALVRGACRLEIAVPLAAGEGGAVGDPAEAVAAARGGAATVPAKFPYDVRLGIVTQTRRIDD